MQDFLVYMFKTGIYITAILLIYKLFFGKSTFFRFNRFFLLFGLISSLIVPAIVYRYDVVINIISTPITHFTLPTSDVAIADTAPKSKFLDTWTILFVVYVTGFAFLLIKNLVLWHKLSGIKKRGITNKSSKYTIIVSNEINSPFSILNYIFIKKKNLSITEKDIILKHEITHISQKHWLDLLCSECMLMLQWFNPFMWIYVFVQKENHEYLADSTVINNGVSSAVYQAVLINQQFKGPVFSFSNSFNYSNNLNRLAMIKKSKSSSLKKIAILLVFPVFGCFIWTSAQPNYVYVPKATVEIDSTEVIPFAFVEKRPTFNGKDPKDAFVDWVENKCNYPEEARAKKIQGTVRVALDVEKDGAITNVRVTNANSVNPLLAEEVLRVVKSSPKWVPGSQNGKPVKVPFTFSMSFVFQGDKAVIDNSSPKITQQENEEVIPFAFVEKKPIFNGKDPKDAFVDWVKIKCNYPEEARKKGIQGSVRVALDVEKDGTVTNVRITNANSVDPLLAEETLRIVKSSPKWVPGSQNGKPVKVPFTFSVDFAMQGGKAFLVDRDSIELYIRGAIKFDGKSDPMILIDGFEATKDDLARLSPDSIASFNVLKDPAAKAIYGEKTKNGIVMVTTKNAAVNTQAGAVVFGTGNAVTTQVKSINVSDTIVKQMEEYKKYIESLTDEQREAITRSFQEMPEQYRKALETTRSESKPNVSVSIKQIARNKYEYYVNTKRVELKELEPTLKSELAGQKDPIVSLSADESVTVKELTSIMSIGSRNGYRMILATSPK